MQKSNYLVN